MPLQVHHSQRVLSLAVVPLLLVLSLAVAVPVLLLAVAVPVLSPPVPPVPPCLSLAVVPVLLVAVSVPVLSPPVPPCFFLFHQWLGCLACHRFV